MFAMHYIARIAPGKDIYIYIYIYIYRYIYIYIYINIYMYSINGVVLWSHVPNANVSHFVFAVQAKVHRLPC